MLNVVLLCCCVIVLLFCSCFSVFLQQCIKNDHTKKEFVEIQNRYSNHKAVNVTLLVTFDVLDHIYSTVLEVCALNVPRHKLNKLVSF